MTGFRIVTIDPPRLGDEIIALWNRELGDRFPLDRRLFEQNLSMERNRVEARAAMVQSGAMAGFILWKQNTKNLGSKGAQPEQGHISALLVSSEYRRESIASALLCEAQKELTALGVKEIHFGGDTYHFFPGAPLDDSSGSKALHSFLLKKGFHPGSDDHDLIADLGSLDFAALAGSVRATEGYTIVPYNPRVRSAVSSFFARCFPGRWEQDMEDAFSEGMGGSELLLLVDPKDEVVGFSRVSSEPCVVLGPSVYWRAALGPFWGGLGPIGVDSRHRGKGLGLLLLYRSLLELSHRGVRNMAIDWTDLVGFYGKMGFRIWKSYRHYSIR